MSALPPNLHTQTSACQLAVVWAELTEHAQLGDRRVEVCFHSSDTSRLLFSIIQVLVFARSHR